MAQPCHLPGPLPFPRASGSCTETPGFLMALVALLLLSIHMGPFPQQAAPFQPRFEWVTAKSPFPECLPSPPEWAHPQAMALQHCHLSCAPPQGLECPALKHIPRAQRVMGAERMLSKYVLSESMNELAQYI